MVDVLSRLKSVRRSGNGWTARCPAHEDGKPSLSICDAGDGKVLVHCHAGCDQEQIIANLRSRGLWPGHGECLFTRFALSSVASATISNLHIP